MDASPANTTSAVCAIPNLRVFVSLGGVIECSSFLVKVQRPETRVVPPSQRNGETTPRLQTIGELVLSCQQTVYSSGQ